MSYEYYKKTRDIQEFITLSSDVLRDQRELRNIVDRLIISNANNIPDTFEKAENEINEKNIPLSQGRISELFSLIKRPVKDQPINESEVIVSYNKIKYEDFERVINPGFLKLLLDYGNRADILKLYFRYSANFEAGTQWSIPQTIFEFLAKDGFTHESFASPINSGLFRLGLNYYSAYPEDKLFDSLGNFFDANLMGTSLIVNPPFVESIMEMAVDKIVDEINTIDKIIIVLPRWEDTPAIKKLRRHGFREIIAKKRQHYYEFNKDSNPTKITANFDSSIFTKNYEPSNMMRLWKGGKIAIRNNRFQNSDLFLQENAERQTYSRVNTPITVTSSSRQPSLAIQIPYIRSLLYELTFFNFFWDPSNVPNPVIIYLGSKHVFHIPLLWKMFPDKHKPTIHVYEPIEFPYEETEHIKLYSQVPTDEIARQWAGRNDVFLISDIKTSGYNKSNKRQTEGDIQMDIKLERNMMEIMEPVQALLKFRLPFVDYSMRGTTDDITIEYLNGFVIKPVWGQRTGIETRLVPYRDEKGYTTKTWSALAYQEMMNYFNNTIRKSTKFVNPFTNNAVDVRLNELTNDYDSIASINVIINYLNKIRYSVHVDVVLAIWDMIINEINSLAETVNANINLLQLRIMSREEPSKRTDYKKLTQPSEHAMVKIKEWQTYDEDKMFLSNDIPTSIKYRRVKDGEIRSTIGWGQRKLAIDIMIFLNHYIDRAGDNPVVVYAGSAPGYNLEYVSKMYPQVEWHLYDPRYNSVYANDTKIDDLKNNLKFNIYSDYFTDDNAKEWSGRDDILFVSDIRTVDTDDILKRVGKRGYTDKDATRDIESGVWEDHVNQQRWVHIMRPVASQLKFRLPWPVGIFTDDPDINFERHTVKYLPGRVFLQPWRRPTSSESRLMTTRDEIDSTKEYRFDHYESRLFYHNLIIRGTVKYYNIFHENDDARNTEEIDPPELDNTWDSVTEAYVLQDYFRRNNYRGDIEKATIESSRLLTQIISGKPGQTFKNFRESAMKKYIKYKGYDV